MNLKGVSPNTMFAVGSDQYRVKGNFKSSNKQTSPEQQINVQVLQDNKYEVKSFVEESDRGNREQLRVGRGEARKLADGAAPRGYQEYELVEEDHTLEALQVEAKCFEGGNRVSAPRGTESQVKSQSNSNVRKAEMKGRKKSIGKGKSNNNLNSQKILGSSMGNKTLKSQLEQENSD